MKDVVAEPIDNERDEKECILRGHLIRSDCEDLRELRRLLLVHKIPESVTVLIPIVKVFQRLTYSSDIKALTTDSAFSIRGVILFEVA